jgi:hypothetical protein
MNSKPTLDSLKSKKCWRPREFKKFNKVEVTNSSGTKQMRYQINTMVEFGDHSFKIKISLADRESMKYPCILGKNFLKTGKFTVDVNQ